MKVTTLALTFLLFLSQVRGEEEVTAFGRRVPRKLISEALVLLFLATMLVAGASIMLMISDGLPMLPAFFEVTSAFGTVGLSLNVTPELSDFGKLLISAVMFLGRVGTVTFLIALAERSSQRRYTFPEEDIAIG